MNQGVNVQPIKGVLFDFTNNAKLKESGFAVDGATVNGFVTKDGITLNMDSHKAWQSTVGHEIAHVLEGTELYTELQSAIKAYAESKGEFKTRYDAITELYKGVADANIDAEFTAELVGEYLFTNEDFILNLSTKNRNVFRKIYDELKYLLKIATAGSKEARELEKVKRAFDKAYKAETQKSTAEGSGVKYSINEEFNGEIDQWDGKTIGFSFVVGETSEALQKSGVSKKQIRWDASKVATLLRKHSGMTKDVVKQIPELLENPIIVVDSKAGANSKVVMGDLYDTNGKIVTAVLLLTPTSKKGNVLDLVKISSAEGRSHIKSLFTYDDGTNVPVRYVDKKRIQSWLNVNRLQLPLHNLDLDSNNSISRKEGNVKRQFSPSTADGKEARELERVKRAFDKAYKAETQKSTAEDSGVKYSITEAFTDNNGTYFENAVLLDTDFFDGISPRNWGVRLRERVEKRASNDPFIMPIIDESGNTTVLQFANSKDRVTKDGRSDHKVIDKLSSGSDNISKLAVIHIDEIITVSNENSPYFTTENNHQWLDKNGWLHRNANVINQKNGNIYNLTIDIAKTADGRTVLYATDGKIKKVGNVQVNSLKIKGSGQNSNFGNMISQSESDVNRKFSLSTADGKLQGENALSLDKYTEKQYNDFGWARDADAISKNELDDMYSKIHEKGSLKKFIQSSNGEAIIEVNDKPHTTLGTDNVFVFVTGTKNNPQISRVARFQFETETEMEIIKEQLYERRSFSNTYYSYLKQYGLAREYSKKSALDYTGYQEKVRRGSIGEESNGTDGIGRVEQDGRGTLEEAQANEIAPMKAPSEDGAFFDGKYSLSERGAVAQNRGYATPLSALRLQEDIAPIGDAAAKPTVTEDVVPVEEVPQGAAKAGDIAPIWAASAARAPTEDVAPIREDLPRGEEAAPKAAEIEVAAVTTVQATRPPKQVDSEDARRGGKKERSWYETSTGSEAVDGTITPDDIPDDVRYYQVKSNKKTLAFANARLERDGYAKTREYFEGRMSDRKLSVEDIALGERLIQEAAKAGDAKAVRDLIIDVSILGTELGQRVQALSMIRRLTPEGQLRALERTIKRGKAKGDKTFDGVEMTEEMTKRITDVYNKDGTFDQAELNRAVEDVKQDIANQMKTGARDYINAWRYLSMLGNPKTHIRNLVSNVAMMGTRAVKNAVARTIETVVPIENRTKTWQRASDDVKAFAKQTTAEMEAAIKGDTKYSEEGSIKAKRQIFKTKVGNALANANNTALEFEDALFSKHAFRQSLQEYLTANGINTTEDIKNNPAIVEKAKDYALEEARKATFRQDSYAANKIAEVEQKNPLFGLAVGAAMPFKKTPINIAKTGAAYSPLGFARNIYDAVKVVKGEMDASEAVDHLAQSLTGTSLALIGYALASAGILNGAGEDDKEGKYDYQLGEQSYSFNFGGDSYSLSWLSPVAMPLFVGANAFEKWVEKEEWDMNVVVDTLAQTLDPLSEMSFISSLDDVLSSYDSGVERFMGMGESAAQNYITQFVPTLFSQIAQTFDDTKRSTKASGNSGFEFGEETLNKLLYKIPGLRNALEPTTDIWGNTQKQNDHLLGRALESFLSPANRREGIATAVDDELKDLYRETGKPELLPSIPSDYINYKGEKYDMSAEEYTAYKETYGQTAYELMERLFDSDTYQNASAEEKADMVSDVYDYARDAAKKEYFDKYDLDFTNATADGEDVFKENPIKGAIENDMSVDEYTFSVESPEKYAVAKSVGGYESYKKYSSELYDIKADKDESGKAISGSRKKKVIDYVNHLDIDYGMRLIIFKSEYNADDTYNYDIIDYLNNRDDISAAEMKSILLELGFEVDDDGNIYW